MAVAAEQEQQQFYLLLGNLLSPDNVVRKQAEVTGVLAWLSVPSSPPAPPRTRFRSWPLPVSSGRSPRCAGPPPGPRAPAKPAAVNSRWPGTRTPLGEERPIALPSSSRNSGRVFSATVGGAPAVLFRPSSAPIPGSNAPFSHHPITWRLSLPRRWGLHWSARLSCPGAGFSPVRSPFSLLFPTYC